MEIKILCDCGVKFKFDVEPVNGRSPGPVNCPGCGKDQTPATDERITAWLAESARLDSAPTAGPAQRITLVGGPIPAMPGAEVKTVPTVPTPAPAAAGHISPKMSVMPVPATSRALSVKPPGEYREETPAAGDATAAVPVSSEPKAAGTPKMAYMPVPANIKALSVKPPGDTHHEEAATAIASAPASEPKAAGSAKMAYMPVPETKTALKVKLPGSEE